MSSPNFGKLVVTTGERILRLALLAQDDIGFSVALFTKTDNLKLYLSLACRRGVYLTFLFRQESKQRTDLGRR